MCSVWNKSTSKKAILSELKRLDSGISTLESKKLKGFTKSSSVYKLKLKAEGQVLMLYRKALGNNGSIGLKIHQN